MIKIKYQTVGIGQYLVSFQSEPPRSVRVQFIMNSEDIRQLMGEIGRIYNSIVKEETKTANSVVEAFKDIDEALNKDIGWTKEHIDTTVRDV